MKLYNYDKGTKEFLGESEARKNPKEIGKFLIPANATSVEIIAEKVGFARCFLSGKWEYIVDNRGKEYYLNGEKFEFKLGDEVTEEMSNEKYTAGELILNEKTFKTSKINTACNNAIIGGFYSSSLGSKHFYYSTIYEQSTINTRVNLGVDLELKAQKVITIDGVETIEERIKILHTHEQLRGVLADMAVHIYSQVEKKDQLEALINQAETVEEVEEIEW